MPRGCGLVSGVIVAVLFERAPTAGPKCQRPFWDSHHGDGGFAFPIASSNVIGDSNANETKLRDAYELRPKGRRGKFVPEELNAAGLMVPEARPTLPFDVCAEYIPPADRCTDVTRHVNVQDEEYRVLQRVCAWI
ncbi:hypothetical protein LZ554_005234 [Drepanopeziza brunnea f. sp. 'monogermtubi']|nr:hypothetical protein LZ554_005234 [Drepanopeziza brunnea f. sp. 'monogermtubi']